MRDFNDHNNGAAPTIRCCLYARISTNDGRQNNENQPAQLREYADAVRRARDRGRVRVSGYFAGASSLCLHAISSLRIDSQRFI